MHWVSGSSYNRIIKYKYLFLIRLIKIFQEEIFIIPEEKEIGILKLDISLHFTNQFIVFRVRWYSGYWTVIVVIIYPILNAFSFLAQPNSFYLYVKTISSEVTPLERHWLLPVGTDVDIPYYLQNYLIRWPTAVTTVGIIVSFQEVSFSVLN